MQVDKLSIINAELAGCGENIVTVADNGSPEWNATSAVYEAAIQETIAQHDWTFDTAIATLVRVGNSPDELYTDAMAMPNAALNIVWVRLVEEAASDNSGGAGETPGSSMPVDYKIIGNKICLNLDDFIAEAKYVVDPQTAGTGAWPPLFTKIIRLRVRAAIYRGLKEDDAAADKAEAQADAALQAARTRVDQQQPKRATFNSRAISARFVRRPFVRTPFPWGGTGVPN